MRYVHEVTEKTPYKMDVTANKDFFFINLSLCFQRCTDKGQFITASIEEFVFICSTRLYR